MRTGIIACPIDPSLPNKRYLSLKDEIKPSYIIDDTKKIEKIEIKNINKASSQNNYENSFVMLYSSGTTGNPKGILHTPKSLITSAESFAKLSGMNSDSIIYHHFPMYYMAGIFNMFLCPMVSGSKIVLGKRFSKEQMFNFWDIPMKYGVNNLTLTPTMAISLVKIYRNNNNLMQYIKSISHIITTGSYLYESIYDDFKTKFSISLQTCYGVTEVGGTITYMSREESASFNDSAGFYDKNIKFKCNGTEKTSGEIIIKTPFMMSGYFINGKIISGLKNGYFNTGDIGYLKNNRLFITGRKSDRIKKGGEFISIPYIENILMKSDLINELSVIGFEEPFWGNKILVFYIPNSKIKRGKLKSELINYGLKYLTSIEMPDDYIQIEKMPTTSIGKIKKKDLISRYKKNNGI